MRIVTFGELLSCRAVGGIAVKTAVTCRGGHRIECPTRSRRFRAVEQPLFFVTFGDDQIKREQHTHRRPFELIVREGSRNGGRLIVAALALRKGSHAVLSGAEARPGALNVLFSRDLILEAGEPNVPKLSIETIVKTIAVFEALNLLETYHDLLRTALDVGEARRLLIMSV
jgi:hypothetical protein